MSAKWPVICEDEQHVAFLSRFARGLGVSVDIRLCPHKDQGSKEQWVRNKYIELSKNYRSRAARVGSICFVIMTDGDKDGWEERLRRLEKARTESGAPPRGASDRCAIFIPTWHIETWLYYLDGHEVEEGSKYKRELDLDSPRECRPQVNTLLERCKSGVLPDDAPPSLRNACDEFRTRIKPLLAPTNSRIS